MNKEEKKAKKVFYEKSEILQVSRVPMLLKIWSSSALQLVSLWSVKAINIGLKIVFAICRINFRIQHLTCPLIDYCATIRPNISLKSLPCEFSHCIFHQPLIIHFLVNDLLLPKFIQARHRGKGLWTKNNLFVPCDGAFDGFFKLFLYFHTILTWYIQRFCKF